MTPEEVFSQLRDIHFPETAAAQGLTWAGLDPRPLMAFAVLVAVLAILPAWHRWRTRRFLKAQIAGFAHLPPSDQRDALAHLAKRMPQVRPLEPGRRVPPAFFRPPADIFPADAKVMRKWLMERVR
ncbi:MAG: hypothetical protein AB8B85_16575 [Paracoccaceae bacterium]